MRREKIVASIISALDQLENSLQTLAKNNDEEAFSNFIWPAAAETEYALFLLSLTRQDESDSSPRKQSYTPKQHVEVKPALVSARGLLRRAKDSVEAGDFVRAYEETWTARNMLLRVEELLEKKRKSVSTKTTSAATQSP